MQRLTESARRERVLDARLDAPPVVSPSIMSPFRRWIAPGPEVAMQTPTSPVNFAWPPAMKEAISS
jgi:hypothetical protein